MATYKNFLYQKSCLFSGVFFGWDNLRMPWWKSALSMAESRISKASYPITPVKHPTKMMIWSINCSKGVGRVSVVEGKMNSKKYTLAIFFKGASCYNWEISFQTVRPNGINRPIDARWRVLPNCHASCAWSLFALQHDGVRVARYR